MPYKVEVRSILESLSASREVSGSFVAPDVVLGAEEFRFAGPVEFVVTLTNAGAGIVMTGRATARVETACARCLCDVSLDVEAPVDGFYVRPGREADFPEEQEVEPIAEDSTIDLESAVTQSLVVELPFAPLHDPECKGICPMCGTDRNVSECPCAPGATPSPFDALRDIDL